MASDNKYITACTSSDIMYACACMHEGIIVYYAAASFGTLTFLKHMHKKDHIEGTSEQCIYF